MAVFEGNNVNLDYGDLELTEELEEALSLLDDSCACDGGTYDINETEEEGAEWEAVPADGPYDTLYFVDGDWTDTLGGEEDDEAGYVGEDEEDEDYRDEEEPEFI